MPSSSLPPVIMTSEKGTFARQTIEELKANIVDRVLADFDYTSQIREALLELRSSLTQGTIQPLQEITSDKPIWDEDIQPWLGKSWLAIPWLLAETYFYRRLLEAVQYFQPGPWQGKDPYRRMKTTEILQAFPPFAREYENRAFEPTFENFSTSMSNALWGNRADLSNLKHFENNTDTHTHTVIRDDSQAVFDLLSNKPAKIAYFFDNIGRELYFDLAFIHYLLESGLAESITFYLKNQPYFVSDAMPEDLDFILGVLESSNSAASHKLAIDLKAWIQSGVITVEAPPILATSRIFHRLPESLKKQLKSFDLAILKGDANYRRLIGDCHWVPTTPFEDAAGHFPTSVVSLRTTKSEMVVGLSQELLDDLEQNAESDWMFNGDRGMISFMEKQA
ncbi:MAG: protein-glutamate O-methyltransferase family protein [Anaerolineaceae bacterium]|nr:protein-glutamate O-methyltransferase family protein [Anaerolineaceae bacterium]